MNDWKRESISNIDVSFSGAQLLISQEEMTKNYVRKEIKIVAERKRRIWREAVELATVRRRSNKNPNSFEHEYYLTIS